MNSIGNPFVLTIVHLSIDSPDAGLVRLALDDIRFIPADNLRRATRLKTRSDNAGKSLAKGFFP